MRPPVARKEGYRILPLVVAVVLLAGLARPARPEEYHRIMAQQVLLHEPLSAEVPPCYLAKGRVLAGFLWPGMTREEVRGVLGVRPNSRARAGEWWTDSCSLLGVTVRYRVAEVAGEGRVGLVVEDVQATPP